VAEEEIMADIVDLDGVEDSIARVENAVERVEKAIKNKTSSIQLLLFAAIGVWLISIPGQIWHAKWRYALQYSLSSDKIYAGTAPHDCGFLTAPIGEKYCHYERVISTTRWATSTQGLPIISWDEGKTWNVFSPDAGEHAPQYSTVKEVSISWVKKDDD
jgi:hypothetical protein